MTPADFGRLADSPSGAAWPAVRGDLRYRVLEPFVAAMVIQALADYQDFLYKQEAVSWLETVGLAWLDALRMDILYQALRRWLAATRSG